MTTHTDTPSSSKVRVSAAGIQPGIASIRSRKVIALSPVDVRLAGFGRHFTVHFDRDTHAVCIRAASPNEPGATQTVRPRPGCKSIEFPARTALEAMGLCTAQSARYMAHAAPGVIVIDTENPAPAPSRHVSRHRADEEDAYLRSHGAPPIPSRDVRMSCVRVGGPAAPADIWLIAWRQRHASARSFTLAWQPVIRAAQDSASAKGGS